MEQMGTVLVFKADISEEEAKIALDLLKDLLDHDPSLNTFDPAWGGPVWYVP